MTRTKVGKLEKIEYIPESELNRIKVYLKELKDRIPISSQQEKKEKTKKATNEHEYFVRLREKYKDCLTCDDFKKVQIGDGYFDLSSIDAVIDLLSEQWHKKYTKDYFPPKMPKEFLYRYCGTLRLCKGTVEKTVFKYGIETDFDNFARMNHLEFSLGGIEFGATKKKNKDEPIR